MIVIYSYDNNLLDITYSQHVRKLHMARVFTFKLIKTKQLGGVFKGVTLGNTEHEVREGVPSKG